MLVQSRAVVKFGENDPIEGFLSKPWFMDTYQFTTCGANGKPFVVKFSVDEIHNGEVEVEYPPLPDDVLRYLARIKGKRRLNYV